MSIVRLNEAALYAMGMDRVTVNALTHFIRQIGAEEGGHTLPQVADQVDNLDLAFASAPQPGVTLDPADWQAPVPAMPQGPDDQAPLAVMAALVESLQTEVRSLAEQLAVARAEINEVKQGPMP